MVVIVLDINSNNAGLLQWLSAGFISTSIGSITPFLAYKKVIGHTNNIWKTLSNLLLLYKYNKYKFFIGFLVIFITFFFIFWAYTNIILYIFEIEVNYPVRLIIAFSLIVPIAFLFAIVDFILAWWKGKIFNYNLNVFFDRILSSISLFRILFIFTSLSFSSYLYLPGKIRGGV